MKRTRGKISVTLDTGYSEGEPESRKHVFIVDLPAPPVAAIGTVNSIAPK